MSSKKHTIKHMFHSYIKQVRKIISDVLQLYKNFFHWGVSKVLISLFSIVLGFLLSAPVLLLLIIFTLFDGVKWMEIIETLNQGGDIPITVINSLALYPYSVAFVVFLSLVIACLFLFGSSYALLLKAHLSLGYLKGKRLKYKKNYYFRTRYILKYLSIISWYFTILLVPVIMWVGVLFFLYLFYNSALISFDTLSIISLVFTAVIGLTALYVLFRMCFGFVILANEAPSKKLHSALHYIKKSVKLTKGFAIFKFVPIYILFVILIAPTSILDSYFSSQIGYMRDTLIFKSGLLQNLDSDQIEYYEYISMEFQNLSHDEITGRLQLFAMSRIVLYFITYFLFSGLFVMILCSFYKRVLLSK